MTGAGDGNRTHARSLGAVLQIKAGLLKSTSQRHSAVVFGWLRRQLCCIDPLLLKQEVGSKSHPSFCSYGKSDLLALHQEIGPLYIRGPIY